MEIVTMTPAARRELERACSKQSNWNDFGHWIGKGNAPNCFQREHYKSTISRVIFFPSDDSASRWNSAWEREIRHGGHCGTVGLTVAVTLISSAGVGAVVGTIAAIFKDELQAKLFYPKVEREWSCSICFNHEYRWAPHPSERKEFYQTIEAKITDHNGEIVSEFDKTYAYRFDNVPQELAIKLSTVRDSTKFISF